MAIRHHITFLLNDRPVRLDDVGANDTVLDFLRIDQRLTGTKEGCAEGDCGACTVLVGHMENGALHYQTVNSCIRFLASLDGCHVVTIEHLRGADGGLHPVQQAMVDHHGAQCGFCTPGIVMSLYALWMENAAPTEDDIETALQGNLCRCTGYEPIIRAAQAAATAGGQAVDVLAAERAEVMSQLGAMQDGARVQVGGDGSLAILPADLDDLAVVLGENPKATIVAGATDVGLWVTKFLRPISPAVHITHLPQLRELSSTPEGLTIGAAVSYSGAQSAILDMFPHLAEYWARIAGWQVRNMGTIGGNIANGSPIGDTPPVLIALNATITLRKGAETRVLPLQDFFIDYGKQDRAQGEFVQSIHIPAPKPGQHHAAYKISKRRDEDISSVAAGFSVTVKDGMIAQARLAFGGMAATPKRAAAAEAALVGQPFDKDSLEAAAKALVQDFTPLSDWRATAEYRMLVSQNLLRRFWMDHAATQSERLVRA